jgi:hypothetical protein
MFFQVFNKKVEQLEFKRTDGNGSQTARLNKLLTIQKNLNKPGLTWTTRGRDLLSLYSLSDVLFEEFRQAFLRTQVGLAPKWAPFADFRKNLIGFSREFDTNCMYF